MIQITCSFFSENLGREVPLQVLLPKTAGWDNPCPALYLLHGLTDNGTSWLRRTSLERYADDHNLAIVMPDAARSFYSDMAGGDRYLTFVGQEVVDFCERVLPISRDRRYVAGNSMGGYGACKIALRYPGRFSKVGTFSGVLDVQSMVDRFPELNRDWQLCFGGTKVPQQEDVLGLLMRGKEPDALPEISLYCGSEDFLAGENQTFLELCRRESIPLTVSWEEGGYHDWPCWDRALPALLQWLEADC